MKDYSYFKNNQSAFGQNEGLSPLLRSDPKNKPISVSVSPVSVSLPATNVTVPTTYTVSGPNLGDFKVVRVSPGGKITIFSSYS